MKRMIALISLYLLFSTHAVAATFSVNSQANGGFGIDPVSGDFGELIAGPSLSSGETISISATGTINGRVENPLFSGPDGIFTEFLPDTFLNPLDEAKGLTWSSTITDGLALMGLFVPVTDLPGLKPFSVNKGGDLSATGLFFVGSRLAYSAPGDGILYFGINDLRPWNNEGAFEVTISVVPAPFSAILFVTGLGALGLIRIQRAKA